MSRKVPGIGGRKELSDSRNVWDWIKYNIRAHAINYSKEKSQGKKCNRIKSPG